MPFLLLCNSEFPLVDLMHLDAINALTEKLTFKVNAGPTNALDNSDLEISGKSLEFMFMQLILFISNALYPCLLFNKGAGTTKPFCAREFLIHIILNVLKLFLPQNICNGFLFFFHNHGVSVEGLRGPVLSPLLMETNLNFLEGKAPSSWSHCLDAPQCNPLYSNSFLRGCSQAFIFKTMEQAASLQYTYLWSWSWHENVRKDFEVHRIGYSKPMEVEIYLQFNTLLQNIYAIKDTWFPIAGWFDG